MSFSDPEKPRKLLIITSSGGGGLIQAAIAKEQEALAADPGISVVKKDVLKDWVWGWLGLFSIGYWNSAQKRGSVAIQVFSMRAQWAFDLMVWPTVFYRTMKTLFDEEVDRVIDTQNMCTSAIVKAIRIYNKKMAKKIVLEKVVVDLPTKQAIHYFRPIKALSKRDKQVLKLISIAPLLEEGQTAEEFWQENCGVSDKEIQYEDFIVRQHFRKLKGKSRSKEALPLRIRFRSAEELQLIERAVERGSISAQIEGDEILFSISPRDRVMTILLGSQPAGESTFKYVEKFIQLAKESQTGEEATHLFVFCADHRAGQSTLFRKISDHVGRMKGYPKHFSVIPFSFQKDDVIAPLFHRCDLTCTRSGGQTAMELMAVSTGEMWIHSEAKKGEGEMSLEDLLAGIPGWEGASALYLQKLCRAKIVTPDTFAPHARRLLRSSCERSSPTRDPGSKA